jgi:DNA-binding CsgD family transcriptional regulator
VTETPYDALLSRLPSGAENGVAHRTDATVVCADDAWEHAIAWLLRSVGFSVTARGRHVSELPGMLGVLQPLVAVVEVCSSTVPDELLRCLRAVGRASPTTGIVAVSRQGGDPRLLDCALAGGAEALAPLEDAVALLAAVTAAAQAAREGRLGVRPALTRKEFEVLRLLRDGRTTRDVARLLWVTEQTVKYHLANVYRKLGVRTRAEALAWAAQFDMSRRRETFSA